MDEKKIVEGSRQFQERQMKHLVEMANVTEVRTSKMPKEELEKMLAARHGEKLRPITTKLRNRKKIVSATLFSDGGVE